MIKYPEEILYSRVKELERALSFYANEDNWLCASTGFAAQYDPEPPAVQRDRGLIARRALGVAE